MLILHAPNVHGGGGLTLMLALLEHLPKQSYLIIDERFPINHNLCLAFQVRQIKPTLWARFKAELFLARLVQPDDVVLCFGNLPPLFKLKGKANLFLQNRYLVDSVSLQGFSAKLRARLVMERLWLKYFHRHVNEVIVQTPTMQAMLDEKWSVSSRVLPFVADGEQFSRTVNSRVLEGKTYEFIYVASGEPHKNHLNLIKAWVMLAKQGIHPFLALTLDVIQFPELTTQIDQLQTEYALNVINLGFISRSEMQSLYLNSNVLIFPSTLESFGIPLIEARSAGLSIVASELDFVRDIVDPEVSFDPSSPVSISRAVKRYLGEQEDTLQLLDAKTFLCRLFKS